MSRNLSFLKTLILSNCGLNSEDLSSLAQTKVEGRLSNLRHLDISNNTHLIENIFKHSSWWETLRKLNIANKCGSQSVRRKRPESRLNALQRLDPYIEKGFLSSMIELRFSVDELKEKFRLVSRECWRQVKRLEIVPSSNADVPLLLVSIADAVEDQVFPSLETICIVCEILKPERIQSSGNEDEKVENEIPEFVQRLMRAGKIVHFIEPHIEELITRIGFG